MNHLVLNTFSVKIHFHTFSLCLEVIIVSFSLLSKRCSCGDCLFSPHFRPDEISIKFSSPSQLHRMMFIDCYFDRSVSPIWIISRNFLLFTSSREEKESRVYGEWTENYANRVAKESLSRCPWQFFSLHRTLSLCWLLILSIFICSDTLHCAIERSFCREFTAWAWSRVFRDHIWETEQEKRHGKVT